MKFNTLYNSLLLEHKQTYTNDELKNYIRYELYASEGIAKIANEFIHKEGFYDLGARVITSRFKYPGKPLTHAYYDVIAPDSWADYTNKDPKLKNVFGRFDDGLWKYGLSKNPKLWADIMPHGDSYEGRNRMENSFIGPPGYYDIVKKAKAIITEYDPMKKYNVDDETKDTWKDVIPNL